MKSIDSERQLLECFVAKNDPDAFRVLIERHGAKVLAVCRSVLRARHDAEDVFQDTFLALARMAHTIKHSDRLGAWLRRTALRNGPGITSRFPHNMLSVPLLGVQDEGGPHGRVWTRSRKANEAVI